MNEQRLMKFINPPVLILLEDRARDPENVLIRSMHDWVEHPRYDARNILIPYIMRQCPVAPWLGFYRNPEDAPALIDDWIALTTDREFPPNSDPRILCGSDHDLVRAVYTHIMDNNRQVYLVAHVDDDPAIWRMNDGQN